MGRTQNPRDFLSSGKPARKPDRRGLHLKPMIRKLKAGQYRLYSRKKNPKTGRRRNLGTFSSRAAAAKHEREVQYFKKA